MAEEFILPKPIGPATLDTFVLPEPIGPATEEEDDASFLSKLKDAGGKIADVGRGVPAGFVNIGQGLAELGTSGLEAAGVLDEEADSQRKVTNFFTESKEKLGLVPKTTAGKVVETIVNYGAPGLGVFSWVSKVDKTRKALQSGTALPTPKTWFGKSAQSFGRTKVGQGISKTRTGRAAMTTTGTGVADFFVSPSTMTTLSDNWDAMPDQLQTESEEGLIGKELSAVRLRNKFRLGIEGAMFNAAGEVLLPVVGGTVRSAAMIPGVPMAARGLSAGFDYLGSKVGSVPFVRKYLTPNGYTPPEIATAIRTVEGMTESEEQIASKLISNYDSAIKKAIRFQRITGQGKTAIQRAYNDTMDYLTGEMLPQDFKATYGAKATKSVDNMRNQVDDLSRRFETSVDSAPNLTDAQKTALREQFQNNQGTYIRRLYELHLDPKKFTSVNVRELPQYSGARQQVENFIQNRNPQLPTGDAARQAEQIIDDLFNSSLVSSGLDPDARAKQIATAVSQGLKSDTSARSSLYRLSDGMLKERQDLFESSALLREMMGEIKNPREAFLRTVDSITSTMSAQRLFDTVSATGIKPLAQAISEFNTGARPMVIDGTTVLAEKDIRDLAEMGYVKAGDFNPDNAFGGSFGSLSGHYVPVEMYNSLTTPTRAYSGVQDALAVALQFKGVSQMSKTVLNPLSQVRNFLSNTFIVGANGLLGRNLGLFESADVLLANAIDNPEQFKLLRAMGNEGAIGQNIQLNELTRLMKEQTESGVSARLRKAGDTFRTSVIGAPVRFLEKTYQLGDDYWKVVGALGEKARYGAALRKADVDIENVSPAMKNALVESGLAQRASSMADTDFGNMLAIDIVKSTMPVYSMVPEAIKQIRRIPVVGNFMAFPAEIMRTTGNIVNRAVKELGFKPTEELITELGERKANAFARQIRGIGAQRLTGYLSMAGYAPYAFRDASHTMLNITPEEEEALETFGPFWSLGNVKAFLTKPNEKGEAEYVDLSYMLPYEFMYAPARAALQTYVEKGEVGAGEAEQILSSTWEGFKKFAEPFASESLGAERLIDVTTRGGVTQTGAPIYAKAESMGDKVKKSIFHVLGALNPGVLEQFVTIKGGDIVPGRASRALTGLPSREGDPYLVAEEVGTLFTGLRSMKFNTPRSLGYAAGEYSSLNRSASSIFTKLADDNDVTAEQVLEAYVKANDAKRRVQAGLKRKIDKARNSGMSDLEIKRAFKDKGVSPKELNAIIKNKFIPLSVSRDLLREVNEEVNVKKENRLLKRLPKEQLNEIRRSLSRTPIVSDTVETNTGKTSDFVLPEPIGPASQGFVLPEPIGPAPTTNVLPQSTTSKPTTLKQIQDKTRTILGTASNPISALRDLEIFKSSTD